MGKKILLTGAGGFIGAHCLKYWLENTDWEIICLDSFCHKGYCARIEEVKKSVDPEVFGKRVRIYQHDLTVPIDPPLENLLLDRRIDDRGVIVERPFNFIFNLASDSAVERSATDPTHCWKNNCNLIATMLEFARKIKLQTFFQISTDEVYGEAKPYPFSGHEEWDTIMPSNPYAASKAAQEALCISYWRTYKVPIVLTNCMNIVGEWQDPEKFLPKIVQIVAQGKQEMPIYADEIGVDVMKSPSNHKEGDIYWNIGSRVYLDARNKADALMFLTKHAPAIYGGRCGERPDRYNICGEGEWTNLVLAQAVAKIMGKELKYKLIPSESARPGYDRRYALEGKKLKDLGWTPPYTMEQTLRRVVYWTIGNNHWLV